MRQLKQNPVTSFQPGEPLQVLFRAVVIMLLALLIGLFIPGFIAFSTGVFYDGDVVAKMGQMPKLQTQYLGLRTYQVEREALRKLISSVDLQIESSAASLQTAETVKDDLNLFSLRRALESRLKTLKPPVVASGFFLGSTMLLWPIAFTCLGWLVFLIPPFIERPDKRVVHRLIAATAAIVVCYRWPTWVRNFLVPYEGRVSYGVNNFDIDPIGFFTQEALGMIMSFLIAAVWVKWNAFFVRTSKELKNIETNPVHEAMRSDRLEQLSKTFLHWQLCSILLIFSFLPYAYFFWDAVFRLQDRRYLPAAILVQLLWCVTWIFITLPLCATWYSWQSAKAKAVSFLSELKLDSTQAQDQPEAALVTETIRTREPINPWNLAVSSVAVVVSFALPLLQALRH